MKNGLLVLSLFSALAFGAGDVFADDGDLLVHQSYLLKAGVNYHTGFIKVAGAPAQVDQIQLAQGGHPLCDIRVIKVEYITKNGDFIRSAAPVSSTGAIYAIPEGKIYGIDVSFYQQGLFGHFDCDLFAYAGSAPGTPDPDPVPGEEEELLGAVEYDGGFENDALLPLDGQKDVASFRISIPSFCNNVEILEAGTIRNNTFYAATKQQNGTYKTSILGGTKPSGIAFAVNGPQNAGCDLPIFVRFK